MNKRTMTRLEKLGSKAPAQCGRVFQMTVDEDDPAREEWIEAFRRDQGLTDDDRFIVCVIVKPPLRPD